MSGEEEKPRMVRLNVKVDEDLHTALLRLCVDKRTKLTQLVPALLREALKQQKDKG